MAKTYSQSTKIPRSYKNRVTKRDRISRKQLRQGLKKSLGTGKRMRMASKFLKSECESLLKKRLFNRQQVKNRVKTLKEGGFLRKNVRVETASRKLHTTAAARNKMEKTVKKHVEARKKDYQREERVKHDEKEWLIEQTNKEREIERNKKRIHERELKEDATEMRLSRAASRRSELGLGHDVATRRIKGSMKTDKNKILAEIRNEKPSTDVPEGPLSQIQKEPGKMSDGGLNQPSTPGNGGWSAPPQITKKGL